MSTEHLQVEVIRKIAPQVEEQLKAKDGGFYLATDSDNTGRFLFRHKDVPKWFDYSCSKYELWRAFHNHNDESIEKLADKITEKFALYASVFAPLMGKIIPAVVLSRFPTSCAPRQSETNQVEDLDDNCHYYYQTYTMPDLTTLSILVDRLSPSVDKRYVKVSVCPEFVSRHGITDQSGWNAGTTLDTTSEDTMRAGITNLLDRASEMAHSMALSFGGLDAIKQALVAKLNALRALCKQNPAWEHLAFHTATVRDDDALPSFGVSCIDRGNIKHLTEITADASDAWAPLHNLATSITAILGNIVQTQAEQKAKAHNDDYFTIAPKEG